MYPHPTDVAQSLSPRDYHGGGCGVEVWWNDLIRSVRIPKAALQSICAHSPVIAGNSVLGEAAPAYRQPDCRIGWCAHSRDQVPDSQIPHLATAFDYATDALVSQDRRVRASPGKRIAYEMSVCPGAGRSVEILTQRVILARNGLGDVPYLQHSRCFNHRCPHLPAPPGPA